MTFFSYLLLYNLRQGDMNMCIYIDILVITNIYITWFIIKSVSKITHMRVQNKRHIWASFFGGAASLIIVLEFNGLHNFLGIILKAILFLVINYIAFKEKSAIKLLRLSIISFLVNLCYFSFAYLIKESLSLKAVYLDNFTMYFQLSMPVLIFSTVLAYGVVCLVFYIIERRENKNLSYEISLEIDNNIYRCAAISDSGNNVYDIFSKKPVVIFSNNELLEKIRSSEKSLNGFRLIPYHTVSSSGLLPVFYPEKICIVSNDGKKYQPDVMVGVVSDSYSGKRAVFNPRIIFE